MSGWGDSNSRPPRPERGALTGLRYTPKLLYPILLYIKATRAEFVPFFIGATA
jgi:hypothetical protein